ncbi:MAG: integrase core domain-containing protein, partial [Candidatus Omnitrophica bacterium]|nr:integrase core domain-containing protein [Candidatus Omnitrophota bacterium]
RKSLLHYWTRVRTPKDNAEVERFIRTIEEEFLELGNYTDDVELFNKNLVEYLIEYNFTRPHQSLGYDTPINFLMKKFEGKLLPMYSNYAMS